MIFGGVFGPRGPVAQKPLVPRGLFFVGFARDAVGTGLDFGLASESSLSEPRAMNRFCLLVGGAISRCQ